MESPVWPAACCDVKGGVVHDAGDDGVVVEDDAFVTLVGVEVRGNKLNGVTVDGGNLTARDCKIRKNGKVGAEVTATGNATFEKCDLSGNGDGAWKIDDPAKVVRKGNTPAK